MGTATWQPKWWNAKTHGSTWDRAKEAMKRDWEQTKNDIGAGGRDLDQDVDDTMKQAAGKDVIPPRNQPNAPGGTPANWSDVEEPIGYGFSAREHYGKEHPEWSDKLENKLQHEWEEAKDTGHRAWTDVKQFVRRGYDRARS